LAPVDAATRVVLLRHPREARMAICSAWLTRLALVNAELHTGFRFGGDPHVTERVRTPGAVLLYPGEVATPAAALAHQPPPVLIVIDGTWLQAEKMLEANPEIAALPRMSVDAGRPSGYTGLRAEPAPHCLSTIEAVALALGALERDHARFEPMCKAFRLSVEKQIACSQDGRRNPRHRKPRKVA
jgi:DTW domain-containing protein YfiP